jgi:hypothetical protein
VARAGSVEQQLAATALGAWVAERATRLKIVRATNFMDLAYSIFLESVKGFLTSDTRNEKGRLHSLPWTGSYLTMRLLRNVTITPIIATYTPTFVQNSI